jgi:hypothetical protein
MSTTPEEIERIATEAATKAARAAVLEATPGREELARIVSETVKQTLVQLGVDAQDPIQMQRDFQHLRQWRRAGEDLRSKGMLALLGIFLTGLVSLVGIGVKEWFTR